MLKVIETFSGIGAQAKALKNIGCDFKIIGTADWDINAIIAYDLIHNGPQDLSKYEASTKEEMIAILDKYTLSNDGKVATEKKNIRRLSTETLRRVCSAIDRTNNYVSVTDMKGDQLPKDMNVLTYSFPCQDLSVAHAWHGRTEGIDRSAGNRSSMLWQIERILIERKDSIHRMPRFLLMENVPNIMSTTHNKNFNEWKKSLETLGYVNQPYILKAYNFGSPQVRKRAYLISVFVGDDNKLKDQVNEYFLSNNIQEKFVKKPKKRNFVSDYLRTDYSVLALRHEANESQPSNTISRKRIFMENVKLFDGKSKYSDYVPTITTKQDRHPNSGVIIYPRAQPHKANYRYLTGRECLLLMGFEDQDFEAIMQGNFKKNVREYFFSNNKIVKLAGNSIVVPVLEEVFRQINDIDVKFMQKAETIEDTVNLGLFPASGYEFAV